MKTIKLWEVTHHQNDRGTDRGIVRYAATEAVATWLARQQWGFCGQAGEAKEVELKVYETAQEVLDESR